jgi:hypothetical protein
MKLRYLIPVVATMMLSLTACPADTNAPGGHDFENGNADAPVKGAYIDSSHPLVIWNGVDGYPNILCMDLRNGLYAYVASGNGVNATEPYYSEKPCLPETIPSDWRVAGSGAAPGQ